MLALLLALQESGARASEPVLPAIAYDLRDAPPLHAATDAIVIMGRRQSPRLEPLPEGFGEDAPLRAVIGLGGGALSLDAKPTILPNGLPSNRIMLSWQLKF
jgi:hypothetical protein